MYEGIINETIEALELNENTKLIQMDDKLTQEKNKLKAQGGTCALWIQYMEMMDLFKANVRADRIG